LQRLAETGEESVLVMTDLYDGTNAVLASLKGEKFIQEQANGERATGAFLKEFSAFIENGKPTCSNFTQMILQLLDSINSTINTIGSKDPCC